MDKAEYDGPLCFCGEILSEEKGKQDSGWWWSSEKRY